MYPGTDATGQLHRHGTSCAGVLVMAKDNDICGVGVAYNSKVAGIRLLSGTHHSDATEAIALGLNSQHIDIYSNSWGPYDDGIVVDGPGHLALAALEQGVRKVRCFWPASPCITLQCLAWPASPLLPYSGLASQTTLCLHWMSGFIELSSV